MGAPPSWLRGSKVLPLAKMVGKPDGPRARHLVLVHLCAWERITPAWQPGLRAPGGGRSPP
eukprot:14018064-Alexandrium_andersonii.AAC.1